MIFLTTGVGAVIIPYLPLDQLWIIGLEFGVIKELNGYVMNKLIRRAAGADKPYAKGCVTLNIVGHTNLFIVKFISEKGDYKTTICFIMVDIIKNAFLVLFS